MPKATKNDLIEAVVTATGVSKAEATRQVGLVIDCLAGCIAQHGEITLVGFGTFVRRVRAPRSGRNPQTGETMKIGQTTSVGFRATPALKERVMVRKKGEKQRAA